VLGPVEVPCNGTVSAPPFKTGPNFTTSACDENDNMPKWQYWLDEWAKKTYGVNAADYHHRAIVLPRTFSGRVKGEDTLSLTATDVQLR
jgi:hypothetical protein